MNVSADHWIEGVNREPIAGGNEMPIRRALVIHFTSGANALSSIQWWRNPGAKGASAHIVIDRDGKVFQCRPFNRTAGHAGVSRWQDPKTGVEYSGLNSCSIGIELANAGEDEAVQKVASKLPGFRGVEISKHRNGGPSKPWEIYPEAQLAACIRVAKALCGRYHLDDITGHDCIAPERKLDPGPLFPMQDIREYCGFAGLPVVHRV